MRKAVGAKRSDILLQFWLNRHFWLSWRVLGLGFAYMLCLIIEVPLVFRCGSRSAIFARILHPVEWNDFRNLPGIQGVKAEPIVALARDKRDCDD